MKITVVQPKYYSGETPDKSIAEFLLNELEKVENGGLIVLPEYSNAGGLSDPEKELAALSRADEMKKAASQIAKEKSAYVVINVLEKREGKIKNSSYLFNTTGETAFIYDKIHLPPSEVKLGVAYGDGSCTCELDGMRFGFMTCYDVYYNEQIEAMAKFGPDILVIPGYQRGERTDIIRAQAKLTAFRLNCFIARSSYSMDDEEHGGCSMIVSPDGVILKDLGRDVGSISTEIDPKFKYMRPAGFGEGLVPNDQFISAGLRPEIFETRGSSSNNE